MGAIAQLLEGRPPSYYHTALDGDSEAVVSCYGAINGPVYTTSGKQDTLRQSAGCKESTEPEEKKANYGPLTLPSHQSVHFVLKLHL